MASYKSSSHRLEEIDAAVDGIAQHTADAGVHTTPQEKQKLASLENYDDTELRGMIAQKQDTLTIDNEPTSGSDNPVRSGGVYSALAGKQDKTGQNFEDGANLDDFTESGMFKSIDSTKTATLYNCPVSGFGFIMIVHKLSSAASTQIIYCAGASSAKIFVRQKKSTGWNPWYVFESSTAAPPVNVPAGALNLSPKTDDV